jgi:hypothetical protein
MVQQRGRSGVGLQKLALNLRIVTPTFRRLSVRYCLHHCPGVRCMDESLPFCQKERVSVRQSTDGGESQC